MNTLTSTERLPAHNVIHVTIQFTGSAPYAIESAVPLDDITAHIAKAEAKMDEVGIAPDDRLRFAGDIFTHLSIIPPLDKRQVCACIDLVLWLADKRGQLNDLASGSSCALRLSWSALMDGTHLPTPILENALTSKSHWNAAA